MRQRAGRILHCESPRTGARASEKWPCVCEHFSLMRVVVSNPAFDLIEETGGRVYVWPRKSRCCGAVTTLATSNEPPRRREFVRVETAEPFELYLDARLRRLPDELHLELRLPRRVEAYWDGCAWVV
jgi:uncharacterized protein (DUF58 family)